MNKELLAQEAEKKLEQTSGALRDFRATHLALFKKQDLSARLEDYKFTPAANFLKELEFSQGAAPELNLSQYSDPEFINLLFINGELQGDPVQIQGLVFSNISDAFGDVHSKLQNTHPFSHLHHSLLSSGIMIEVQKKVKIHKPIRVFNLVTAPGVSAPTLFIKLNPLSEATIIEEMSDLEVSHAFINETYIQLDSASRLEHIQLNRGGAKSLAHNSASVSVAKDSTYRNVMLNLSGKLTRNNLKIELQESGAHAETYSLYLTNGIEHSDVNTIIQHQAADTTSNQIAKGILDGESKGIFTGKIHILPHAQRVASGQLNKNLLLSRKAQAHSQPQLEIFADDVKCSHGSTTGQLSDDEVFYFEARGIPANKARTLLAHGFGLEIVLKIQDKTVRSKVEALVMQSLKSKFHLGGTDEHS